MSSFFKYCILALIISFASCTPEKVCSGLNPVIGTYNTSKKIRKGKKVAHSAPERDAIRKRREQMKTTKKFSHGHQGKKGGFHFHLGKKQ